MAGEETITYTTGISGTGKSLFRCPVFIIEEFFRDFPTGDFYSNFPIGEIPEWHTHPPVYEGETFIDRLAGEAARRYGGHPGDYAKRLKIIPKQVESQWIAKLGDPADYWNDIDVQGCKVTIDEIHNFCGRKDSKAWKAKWQAVLGELRHRGAELEVISQSEMKVATEIDYEAGKRLRYISADSIREPISGIRLGHIYEVVSAWTGEMMNGVFLVEEIQQGKKWVRSERQKLRINPFYFQFYNSFSAPKKGGQGGRTRKRPHEIYGRFRILWWCFARNSSPLLKRIVGVSLFFWLTFFGGGAVIFGLLQTELSRIGSSTFNPQVSAVSTADDVSLSFDGVESAIFPAYQDPLVVTAPENAAAFLPVTDSLVSQGFSLDHAVQPSLADSSIVDDLHARLAESASVVDNLESELLAVRSELSAAQEREAETSGVVLLTPDLAVFRWGFAYRVGELIDFGIYEGFKIDRIEYSRRALVLDDGRRIFVGPDRLPSSGSSRTREPDVP